MILSDVMDELGDRLDTIQNLNVYRFQPDSIVVPAAIVGLPQLGMFDLTYQRGGDRLTMEVFALVGKVLDRTARSDLSKFVDGSGSSSFKQVLESGVNNSFHSARVESVRFDNFIVGQIDFLGATFVVDVIGAGA